MRQMTYEADPETAQDANLRTVALVVYGLYLAAFLNGFTAIAGLIVAYVKRGDAAGTAYASHFENAIVAFWVGLVLSFISFLLIPFLIGLPMLLAVTVWVLYRVIKGLLRAIDRRPFD